MSTEFFSNFPTVEYDGDTLVNICLRVGITNTVKQNTSQFLPYTLQYDSETQETVAYDYYNDVNLDWLVEMANDVIDPYYDWKLTDQDVDNVLVNNYGSVANAMSTVVYKQRVPTSNSDPYNVIVNSNTQVSAAQYVSLSAYDYAHLSNQQKGTIYIINTDYVNPLKSSIKDLIANAN